MADVNGKVDAREVVSMFLTINNLSWPRGMVDLNPSSICRVEVFVRIRIELSVIINLFDDSVKSFKLSDERVM
jgi:hypothetical protein